MGLFRFGTDWLGGGWRRWRLLLLYEHTIVSPRDLRRMNAAFFTMNGVIAVVFFGFFAADVVLHK